MNSKIGENIYYVNSHTSIGRRTYRISTYVVVRETPKFFVLGHSMDNEITSLKVRKDTLQKDNDNNKYYFEVPKHILDHIDAVKEYHNYKEQLDKYLCSIKYSNTLSDTDRKIQDILSNQK